MSVERNVCVCFYRKEEKESLAQEVRQIAFFNPYFVCNTSNCVTVRPVRGHLTPKMNIAFFIRNFLLNIFLFDNFSEKAVFSEKTAKNCFGGAFDNFLGKEGVLRRKLT